MPEKVVKFYLLDLLPDAFGYMIIICIEVLINVWPLRGTNGTDTAFWGLNQLGQKFLAEKGFKHVQLSTADGALEAAPAVSTCTMDFHLLATVTLLRLLDLLIVLVFSEVFVILVLAELQVLHLFNGIGVLPNEKSDVS